MGGRVREVERAERGVMFFRADPKEILAELRLRHLVALFVASEDLREALDPTPFVETWVAESCAGDQGEAGALIDNLECDLDHSEEPEDARRREALRYLVARAREAGVLERPAS